MKPFNHDRKKETLKIKLAEIIRRESHPILSFVTISNFSIDRKVQKAHVIFSCFGVDPDEASNVLNGMASALRNKLFLSAGIKNLPPLKFYYNKGLDHADKIDTILARITPSPSESNTVE